MTGLATCEQHGTVHHHSGPGTCCRECGIAWSGYTRAHCATCHETFNSVGAFDRHIEADHSLEKLEKSDSGYWVTNRWETAESVHRNPQTESESQ